MTCPKFYPGKRRLSSKILCVVWKVSTLNNTQVSINFFLSIKIRIMQYTESIETGNTR